MNQDIKFNKIRYFKAFLFFLINGFSQFAQADSLYKESNYRALTSDNKAYKVGDVLTVQVFENSTASTSADTGSRRKDSINADLTKNGTSLKQLGVNIGGEFDGGGRTQRTSKLLATLSVAVREVYTNGDLGVSGEQALMVNDEVQKVSLEGRVRPQDISDQNVVISTRLSDAKIVYMGEGDITDRQRRSWWRRLLDGLGF
ncbi:flagellar basal body L-ring protein FlgH [Undibacterium sp. Ji49W]|uniref:flagellar basal body L-ring protein FlgH n=1 Tax=Undibacterium sp. Ji49W TaxID=3413040 RepID=UPI003BF30431